MIYKIETRVEFNQEQLRPRNAEHKKNKVEKRN